MFTYLEDKYILNKNISAFLFYFAYIFFVFVYFSFPQHFSYSEEIFSQQSRKMSADSSIGSELESEVYPGVQCAAGGDSIAAGSDSNRTDLHNLRVELQNKYHAELEILREDYENRIDELRINNENIQSDLEKKYMEQIDVLKIDLEEAQKYVMTQQEVVSLLVFFLSLF